MAASPQRINPLSILRRVGCQDCGVVSETTGSTCPVCGSIALYAFRGVLAQAKGYGELLGQPDAENKPFYRPSVLVFRKEGIMRRIYKAGWKLLRSK